MRYNPFRPNGIVGPGMFCGRSEEIDAIERSLHQTKHGNPRHFLIQGERGIGKSSLMLLAHLAASGQVTRTDQFNFVVIDVELGTATTSFEFFRKIASKMRGELMNRHDLRAIASSAWEFITSWHVLGVEYRKEQAQHEPLESLDHLATTSARFMEEAGEYCNGIIFLIDEADKHDPALLNLGEFVKLFTERLTRLSCERVCIGLSGLPSVIPKLRQGHESAPRVFETFGLEPLTTDESKEAVNRGLGEAREKNGYDVTITDDAVNMIAHLSEGYPHFLQQFAFCAFDDDTDNIIDNDDVFGSLYREHGALDQLGRKYFQELYYDKIASDDYRKILNAMALELDSWVSRKQILEISGVRESQVTNALNALKARNIILTNDERRGEYRLPTKSFAVWIRATARAKNKAEA